MSTRFASALLLGIALLVLGWLVVTEGFETSTAPPQTPGAGQIEPAREPSKSEAVESTRTLVEQLEAPSGDLLAPSEGGDEIISAPELQSDGSFASTYANVPSALLREEIALLDAAVHAEADPVMQRAFDEGKGVWVANYDPEQGYRMPVDNHVVDGFRFEPSGAVYRVVLEREDHPGIYSLRDQANWIREELERRRSDALASK